MQRPQKPFALQYINRQGRIVNKLFPTVEKARKAIAKAKKHALSSVILYSYTEETEYRAVLQG